MDPVTTARAIAAAHPRATLPCPHCAASVRGANLDRHLERAHPGAAPPEGARWGGRGLFGAFPCSLALERDGVVLTYALGLARRRVALPCALEVGALLEGRPDALTSSYADDANLPGATVRAGGYLRFEGGASAITVGCKGATPLAAHWDRAGFRRGAARRACDVTVDRASLVAIEYALARRGLLTPTPAETAG